MLLILGVMFRFYLGVAMSKSSKSKDICVNFLKSGLNHFLYEMNWKHPTGNTHCISETFANIHNTLFFKGIYELSKLVKPKTEETATFHQSEQLLSFLSMACFLSMFKSVKRGDTYRQLISLALECQYDIGKNLMDGKEKVDVYTQLRDYWTRLSDFTANVCSFGNRDALAVQRKVRNLSLLYPVYLSMYIFILSDVSVSWLDECV